MSDFEQAKQAARTVMAFCNTQEDCKKCPFHYIDKSTKLDQCDLNWPYNYQIKENYL